MPASPCSLTVARAALVALGLAFALTACSTKRAPDRSCPSPAICKRECDVGALGSCTRLARWMVVGGGTKRNVRGAVALLERSCAGDEAFACTTLSAYYRSGIGVGRDKLKADQLAVKAVARYEAECKEGDADSCLALTGARRSGPPKLRNPGAVEGLELRSIELATKECGPARPGSCRVLGYAVESLSNHGANKPESIVYLDKACDNGAGAACLLRAEQVIKEPRPDQTKLSAYLERGVASLTKDCEAGVADRCTQIGVIFALRGEYLKDPLRGHAAYLKGCELGDALGCAHAAYTEGEKDPGRGNELELRALDLFATSCNEGWASACLDLTTRILLRIQGDRGIAQDHPAYLAAYNRAMNLLDRDCDSEDINACLTLGEATGENGRFGEKIGANPPWSKSAYTRACKLGDEYGCKKAKLIVGPEPEPSTAFSRPVPTLLATMSPPVPKFDKGPLPLTQAKSPADAGAPTPTAGDGGASDGGGPEAGVRPASSADAAAPR